MSRSNKWTSRKLHKGGKKHVVSAWPDPEFINSVLFFYIHKISLPSLFFLHIVLKKLFKKGLICLTRSCIIYTLICFYSITLTWNDHYKGIPILLLFDSVSLLEVFARYYSHESSSILKKDTAERRVSSRASYKPVHTVECLGTVDYHEVFACLKDMQMHGIKHSGFDVALTNILERDLLKPQWVK